MKRLLIGLLAMSSLSAFAGDIVNKRNGELLRLSFDSAQKSVSIERINSDGVSLGTIYKGVDALEKNINTEAAREKARVKSLMPSTKELIDAELEPAWGKIFVYALGVPFVGAIEGLELSYRLPKKLIVNHQVKSDIETLETAIKTDSSADVTNRQFNRLFNNYIMFQSFA